MSFRLFGRDTLREKITCGVSVAIFSLVMFAYFFAQNTSEITPHTAGMLALIFFVLAIVSYVPALIIFRHAFTAMIFCVVCWLGFYLSPLLYKVLINWPYRRALLLTPCIIVIAFLAAMIARKTQATLRATFLFLGVLAVIFAMNFGKLLDAASMAYSAANNRIPIKKNFFVNSDSKSPNIYWIHLDGMLGVDIVKKYFADDQKEFLSALSERGFEINPSANFEAHHATSIAIPVLMNPYTYDNWLKEELSSSRPHERNDYELHFIRRNSELQYALSAKDYALNIIGGFFYYYPLNGGRAWLTDSIFTYEGKTVSYVMDALNFQNPYVQELIRVILDHPKFNKQTYQAKIPSEKLKKFFLNGLDSSNRYVTVVAGLYDSLNVGGGVNTEPKLTIIHDLTPHYCYFRSSDGEIIHDSDNMNPLDYHSQHIYATKVFLNTIDLILEYDSDAVIVAQSDHGLHGNSEQDFKKAFGDKANPREIWNSTMSALRVPEKFKTGEEHYALETPLNMTRYLVNSFVGKNYEYVSESESLK